MRAMPLSRLSSASPTRRVQAGGRARQAFSLAGLNALRIFYETSKILRLHDFSRLCSLWILCTFACEI